ncbi:M23 family peptidase [Bifidobacterium rousetti]|uniref:M23 family metallopeptidase n=1 Tax=Bifidobacterium rousetti TaxID=2045439 RepID=UPI00123B7858|nr:M23 family metallopeptidase [Bifidobacterium rousetti]KAA8820312.1 M23 family peptidase [Bifidobacterium rousetti]
MGLFKELRRRWAAYMARASRSRTSRRKTDHGHHRRLMATTLTAAGMMGIMMAVLPVGDVAVASASASQARSSITSRTVDMVGTVDTVDTAAAVGACRVGLAWPLDEPVVAESFDGPAKPWLPGHRGVDLEAEEGEDIVAPDEGVISFAGEVAGKQVVSIRTDEGLTFTFEPAATDLPRGTRVRRGERFGEVAIGSDHCVGSCLHWGVRRGDRAYIDPTAMTGGRRIGLKPVS